MHVVPVIEFVCVVVFIGTLMDWMGGVYGWIRILRMDVLTILGAAICVLVFHGHHAVSALNVFLLALLVGVMCAVTGLGFRRGSTQNILYFSAYTAVVVLVSAWVGAS